MVLRLFSLRWASEPQHTAAAFSATSRSFFGCGRKPLFPSTFAGGETVPQYYTYSATNVRLQEATLSYLIPRKWLGNACDIKVSLVGRNLWMIYNKAPYDPEAVASAGNYFQGIDNFMMPSLRNFGFNVNFNF